MTVFTYIRITDEDPQPPETTELLLQILAAEEAREHQDELTVIRAQKLPR